MNKILVVDDERQVIQHIGSLLQGYGYEFGFIARPELLFKRLEDEPFDLILLDINMPQVDGISLLRQLKQHPHFQTIAVIMMTGETDEKTLAQCFQYGARDFITKPIKELVFHARIKSALDNQVYIKKIEQQQELLNEQLAKIVSQQKEVEDALEIIRKKNIQITSSINYAKRIQQTMLPERELFDQLLPNYFILYRPRDIVSGDIYWIYEQNGLVFLAVVDCTGHGVPGAIMSMIAFEQLLEIVSVNEISEPAQILDRLHANIRAILKQDQTDNRDGMDVALCVIDREHKKMAYSGAHNPLLYVQNGAMQICKADRMAVGGEAHAKHFFSQYQIDLTMPTAFYLFSDGYQDQFGGEKGAKFMFRSFRELLFQIYDFPLAEQARILEQTIEQWMLAGNQKQLDDILILGVKINF